jgi:hypothetical protein
MARALGMGSRQAAMQRYQRLEELAAGNGRAEVRSGSGRGRIAEARWFARNRSAVEGLAHVLAAASFRSAAAADDAESLAEVLEDAEPSTGSVLAWISQILGELERAGEAPQGLEAVLAESARLVSEWQRVRPPLP